MFLCLQEMILVLLLIIPISFILLSKTTFHSKKPLLHYNSGSDSDSNSGPGSSSDSDYLSWRLAVEANNIRAWPAVPNWCHRHMERYVTGGQYHRDISVVVEEIIRYVDGIEVSRDGKDAWILDIDDTCLSNLAYCMERRYGCEPFAGAGFVAWASRGELTAIPAMLKLYKKLIGRGFKVFFITGRDEHNLGEVTVLNLNSQGFTQYEHLFLRTLVNKGQSAVTFKSIIRRRIVEEGYKIRGNVGDQWSDLQGDFIGDRTFKIPNPMYYIV